MIRVSKRMQVRIAFLLGFIIILVLVGGQISNNEIFPDTTMSDQELVEQSLIPLAMGVSLEIGISAIILNEMFLLLFTKFRLKYGIEVRLFLVMLYLFFMLASAGYFLEQIMAKGYPAYIKSTMLNSVASYYTSVLIGMLVLYGLIWYFIQYRKNMKDKNEEKPGTKEREVSEPMFWRRW